MSISDLYVGMKFRSALVDESYGVCIELEGDKFTYNWVYQNGEYSTHSLTLQKTVNMFEYYGWVKLTPLEEELL